MGDFRVFFILALCPGPAAAGSAINHGKPGASRLPAQGAGL